MDTFNDLVDCSLCGCTDESKMDFCMDRDNEEERDANSPCSPSQTLAGGTAIIEFSQCTKFDEIAMLMVEFDQNNFGDLDTFEACAKDYRDTPNHGGRTAMSCLRILVNAIDGATQVTKMDPLLTEAISALAGFLYHNGEGFCDCAVKANEECPICPSFHNFKTLLYESVNACESLDIIDCDAWSEFYNPCKNALTSKYTNIDFSKQEQCQFVHDGCGAEVPFPSFRRMDCTVHKEVTQEAWSFYENYAKSCLKNDNGPTPTPPTPTPPVPSPTTPAPVPFSPTDGGSTPGRKPYVPPEDRDGKNGKPTPSNNDVPDNGDNGTPDDGSSNSTDTNDVSPGASQPKKKSHFFRNLFWLLVLGGGGYWYYKTWGTSLEGVAIFCGMVVRFGNSVVARVRGSRIPFVGGGGGPSGGGYGYASASGNDDAMYSGLAMESSTSFEPASLPPPPSAVGQDTNYYI
uniref:Uncharacterized protein n=1 Tax=Entomoneis paludosa TaxID=265537 RepID=A0A7S2YR92_9STRA|mmetsp:Transcript_6589/g.13774  ORF Transcript_6589/g.13774 Transcript_6589/m.13774 type:complete len:459 (+) Transcript_6589:3-1379(+)